MGNKPTNTKMPLSVTAAPPAAFPAIFNRSSLFSLIKRSCLSIEKLVKLLTHSLSDCKCRATFSLICGKSLTKMPICAEKNHTIPAINRNTNKIGKMMASDSGVLYFLNHLNIGKSIILRKNAMITGIIMSLPTTRMATISTMPKSSIDRFTVSGKSLCIEMILCSLTLI
ncbi:hypothetical protein D9M68_628020 [compost metagenome]